MFLKHTALRRQRRIRITSHLLLRCEAWTHLHLSPSWMGGQATGGAKANANPESQGRRVRVSVRVGAFAVWGNDSPVSFDTAPPNFVRVASFLGPAFKQVVTLLASVSNAGPQTVRSVRVTERKHAARRTLTLVRSLPGKNRA